MVYLCIHIGVEWEWSLTLILSSLNIFRKPSIVSAGMFWEALTEECDCLSVYTLVKIYNNCLCVGLQYGDKQWRLNKWVVATSNALNKAKYIEQQWPCIHLPPVRAYFFKNIPVAVSFARLNRHPLIGSGSGAQCYSLTAVCFNGGGPLVLYVVSQQQAKSKSQHTLCPYFHTSQGLPNSERIHTDSRFKQSFLHCTHESMQAHTASTTPSSFFLNTANGCFKKLSSLCG